MPETCVWLSGAGAGPPDYRPRWQNQR